MDIAKFRDRHRLVGNIAEAILAAQLTLDPFKNLINTQPFRYFEEPATGLLCEPQLSVSAAMTAAEYAVSAGIGKEDRVDQSVGTLGRFERIVERRLAARVDTIR